MSDTSSAPIVIVGPTAVGKTRLALTLAERIGAEVISADSRQVYRGLDIGTGKPTVEERHRVPHHLVDILEPGETYNAGRFAADARTVLADLARRRVRALVVGGTGLYIRALVGGLAALPPRDAALRHALERVADEEGVEALAARLAAVDPESAARIGPRDRPRMIRALEISMMAGRPASALRTAQAWGPSMPALVVGLTCDRAELYRRIADRVQAMLAAGWLDEVRALLVRDVPAEAPGLHSLGYRVLAQHLAGRLEYAEAVRRITRATRQYAKRQRTWFRREPGVRWFDVGVPGWDAEVIALVDGWIASREEERDDACPAGL